MRLMNSVQEEKVVTPVTKNSANHNESFERSEMAKTIKHKAPQYVEISLRLVKKLNIWKENGKKEPKIANLALSISGVCLGAVVGNIPDIWDIIVTGSLGQLPPHLLLLAVSAAAFLVWLPKHKERENAIQELISCIEDEFEEINIPQEMLFPADRNKGVVETQTKLITMEKPRGYTEAVAD